MIQPIRNKFLPAGPVFSLALIGLMLLSGFLYYKAVRFQRFLEPALALTQPGSQFDQQVGSLLMEEFGPEDASDIRFSAGTVQVRESALVGNAHRAGGGAMFMKLGRFFRKLLDSSELRRDVKVILVSKVARVSADPEVAIQNRDARHKAQDRAEGILSTLYAVQPELETKYGTYFEATAISVYKPDADTGWVFFRIIPSERLHIEVLQKLEKYID